MAMIGMRVVEMAGLAPAPFAGMILAGCLSSKSV
jgi:crotonobetainyl-CoA:carnitine CoA-transferase CaiB-like acyl-CoA transferase